LFFCLWFFAFLLWILAVNSDRTEHASSPHHKWAAIHVHVIASGAWYVKFHFIGDPDTLFISVHQ
jgi:hypothetical protein